MAARATRKLHDALLEGPDSGAGLLAINAALAEGASLAAVVDHEDGRVPATLVACNLGRTNSLLAMIEHYNVSATPTSRNPFNATVKTVGGSCPLHTAAAAGHRGCVRALVEHAGVDIDKAAVTEFGGSALFAAVRHGSSGNHDDDAMLRDFISLGADINFTDDKGATPLIIACVADKASFVTTLLGEGADPNIADKRGRQAESYCRPGSAALEALKAFRPSKRAKIEDGAVAAGGGGQPMVAGEAVDSNTSGANPVANESGKKKKVAAQAPIKPRGKTKKAGER
jgi:hypothetical protein